jgi:hypothetical protein
MNRARAREQRPNSATLRPARTTASTEITNPPRAFWMVLPWPRIRCGQPMRALSSLALMLLTTKLWWRPCLESRWWPRASFASSRLLMSPNGLRCEIDQQTRECLCLHASSLFCASGTASELVCVELPSTSGDRPCVSARPCFCAAERLRVRSTS